MLQRTLVLSLIALATMLSASSVSAKDVLARQATLAWSAASGPVNGYAVFEARNGAAFQSAPTKLVTGTSARVNGVPGDVVFIRVAAVDAKGTIGPQSPTSESIRFKSAPNRGGGSSGGNGNGNDEEEEEENDPMDREEEDQEEEEESEGRDDREEENEEEEPESRDDREEENDPMGREEEDEEEEPESRDDREEEDGEVEALGGVDLDDNGTSDLVFFNEENGKVVAWLMDDEERIGTQVLGTQNDEGLEPVDMSDFDGDGKADILWHDAEEGTNETWLLRQSRATVRSLPNRVPGWKMAGCGDFDRDGSTDVMWSHPGGATSLWYMGRSGNVDQRSYGAKGPAGSELAGVGDLDGDGLPDLIWKNGRSLEWWKMNGAKPVAVSSLPNVRSGDRLSHVADLDGDGREDMVWSMTRRTKSSKKKRRFKHYIQVWYSNGMNAPSAGTASVSYRPYQVSGIADMDSDGKPEIAVRTSAGTTVGAEVERRLVRQKRKGRKGRRNRTSWAVDWVPTNGTTSANWKLLTP